MERTEQLPAGGNMTRRRLLSAAPALAVAAATPVAAAAACEVPLTGRERLLAAVDQLAHELQAELPGKFQWFGFPLPGAKEGHDRGFAFLFDRDDAFKFREELFVAMFPLTDLCRKAMTHMLAMKAAHKRGVSDSVSSWHLRRVSRAMDRVLGYTARNFEEVRDKALFIRRVDAVLGEHFIDGTDALLVLQSMNGHPGRIVRRKAVSS